MNKTDQPKVLRPIEEKLIEALKRVDTVRFAAEKVGISTKRAYNLLYRLRKKYVRARRFVNTIDAQKKYRLVRMVLTDRMQDAEPEEKPEEEWLDA